MDCWYDVSCLLELAFPHQLRCWLLHLLTRHPRNARQRLLPDVRFNEIIDQLDWIHLYETGFQHIRSMAHSCHLPQCFICGKMDRITRPNIKFYDQRRNSWFSQNLACILNILICDVFRQKPSFWRRIDLGTFSNPERHQRQKTPNVNTLDQHTDCFDFTFYICRDLDIVSVVRSDLR